MEQDKDTIDAMRYRFLRDNPLQLRAIDGNAGFHGQIDAKRFDSYVDGALEGTGQLLPKIPARQIQPKPHSINGPICGAEDEGFYCTLAVDHVDDHEAYDSTEVDLLHQWPQ